MKSRTLLGLMFIATSFVAPSAVARSAQPRAGYTCVFWPADAQDAAARRSKAFDISWVFIDSTFTGHKAGDVELLQKPAIVTADVRVADFQDDQSGGNMLLQNAIGRFVLTFVPREGQPNEFDAGFTPLANPSARSLGACHKIVADEQFVADLKRRSEK